MLKANRDEPLVPGFSITVSAPGTKEQDLKPADDILSWVTGVSVEDRLRGPTTFTLELMTPTDTDRIVPWSEDKRFALGAGVSVKFGYGGKRELLIDGEITTLAPAFSIGGPPTLTVQGADLRHRLDTVPRIRSFDREKYSGMAEIICRAQNVPVEATDTGVIVPYKMQRDVTDLAFLEGCAKVIQFELVMDGRTLLFRPKVTRKESVATLTLDDDLLEFRPSLTLPKQTRVDAVSWSMKSKANLKASAGDDSAVGMGGEQSAAEAAQKVFGASIEVLAGMSVLSQGELDQMASAFWESAMLEFITGSARCRGRTDLRAGSLVTLEGVGSRFSGDYYLDSVVHSFTPEGGYTTSFQVMRNAS
jgi:phage protein D